MRAAQKFPQDSGELSCLEMFCGEATIAQNFQLAGLPSVGYDVLRHEKHSPLRPCNDVTTSPGFLVALALVLRLSKESSLLWMAVVCSTWVWISRASTQRSTSQPLGTDSDGNRKANQMTSRCALLQVIQACRGGSWAIEQPASSLLRLHPSQ
eukprot:15480189-Alexandrium_andersonii.AAC.1